MPGGYQQIYEGLLPRLAVCDFSEAAGRLGLERAHGGGVYLPSFLGRGYEINAKGVFPADGELETVNVNNLSILAYYVLSHGSGEPKLTFSPLDRLSGMLAGSFHAVDWMPQPLLLALEGSYEKFCAAAKALGAEPEPEAGATAWRFWPLPKIPVRVIFYAADEEFPCELKILFDDHSTRFLSFECLAFLQGRLCAALAEFSKK